MFPYNNCTGNYHAAASPYDLTLHSQKAVSASASKYCFLVSLESAVPPPDLSNSERSCYKSLLNQLNRVAINTSEKCGLCVLGPSKPPTRGLRTGVMVTRLEDTSEKWKRSA